MVAGIVLILLEVVVIPGFGVAGVLGILAFLGGLYISLVDDFSSGEELLRGGYILAVSFVLMVLGAWFSLTFLPRTRSFGGLVLQSSAAPRPYPYLESEELHEDARLDLTGATGEALTDLRPSGAALVNGQRVDVVTEGEYIQAGAAIEVIHDEWYRRIVRTRPDVG